MKRQYNLLYHHLFIHRDVVYVSSAFHQQPLCTPLPYPVRNTQPLYKSNKHHPTPLHTPHHISSIPRETGRFANQALRCKYPEWAHCIPYTANLRRGKSGGGSRVSLRKCRISLRERGGGRWCRQNRWGARDCSRLVLVRLVLELGGNSGYKVELLVVELLLEREED